MVVVTQEADVHVELLDELREYLLAHLGRGGRRGLHQSGGNGRDDQIQAAWHGLLPSGTDVPAGQLGGSPNQGMVVFKGCFPPINTNAHRKRPKFHGCLAGVSTRSRPPIAAAKPSMHRLLRRTATWSLTRQNVIRVQAARPRHSANIGIRLRRLSW